jgi:hypothetical protein
MHKRCLALCLAGLIGLVSTVFGQWNTPPDTVKRYLAQQQALLATDEIALARPSASADRAKNSETRAILQAYDLEPGKTLRTGITLLSARTADPLAVQDLSVQLGTPSAPVLYGQRDKGRVIPLSRVVFKPAPEQDAAAVAALIAQFTSAKPAPGRHGTYTVDLGALAEHWDSLELAARLSEHPAVAWAVPDCAREARKHYLLNDIDGQWHLHNTNTVSATNDSSLAEAWSYTLGDPEVVIAVLDDGLDITHPDLSPNVWTNTGEIPNDGIDNDSNGYIDDVNGWDFFLGTNRITPAHSNENHGTAVSGIAAARGNNGLGVSGAAPLCTLMMVKVYRGDDFVTDQQWADAVDYAATYADVIAISTGTSGILSNYLVNAFNHASTSAVIFSSAGNSADEGVYSTTCPIGGALEYYGWLLWNQAVGSGSHTYRWVYQKDGFFSLGADCAWIDGVSLPDGQTFDFDSGGLPAGWSTGGDASWFPSPEADDYIVSGAYSLRSGEITNSEASWVQVSATGAGTVSFYYQVFGERDCFDGAGPYVWDGLSFSVDGVTNTGFFPDANEDPEAWSSDFTPVEFPAALTSVMAVGASTIDGYRAAYSCFGTNLEFVAPSLGSTGQPGIRTTDRQGTNGYNEAGDYDNGFGGTSATSPLGAGIAALVMSADRTLSPMDVREVLQKTARPIGSVTYTNGFNPRYGYGQVDAGRAVAMTASNRAPEIIAMQKTGTNHVRLTTLGVETGRLYTVYEATTLNGDTWNWTPLLPTNIAAETTLWGTNTTPEFSLNPAADLHIFRVVK